jgi:BlaI family transcriptional regulator, penicillinase repressor
MEPQGELTGAQLEVMEAVWAAGEQGATVAEVWEAIAAKRQVARTTVLTMVARLEERGWLSRRTNGRTLRYVAQKPRQQAVAQLARRFVQAFFSGSPSALLKSLLGEERIPPEELERLKKLVKESGKSPSAH